LFRETHNAAVQRPRDDVSCALQAHNGHAAPAARTRLGITVRCNRLLSGGLTVRSKNRVDASLIARPLRFEPLQHVGVDA
jgi:hypothetical protein